MVGGSTPPRASGVDPCWEPFLLLLLLLLLFFSFLSFFLFLLLFLSFFLSFSSSFAALSFFLFRLRTHVFPESICLGAANCRGPVLRTDNTQPSLFLLPQRACAHFPYHKANPNPNP